MDTISIISKKRDGLVLNRDEIAWIVEGAASGSIPDYQLSSWLMAVFCRGMNEEETYHLTDLMLNSGTSVDLSDISGMKVDKHSTGGVGDKTSMVVAPAAAACGCTVPMMAGRGLGHTGGTLDKLEAIPGMKTSLNAKKFLSVLKKCGLAFIAQTKDFVPADRRLYALRDVTATVASKPLIAGSIMSKKLAEGIDALVLDVKTGSGALMQTLDESRELANKLIDIGRRYNKHVIAFITDMNQPLGRAVGNALEIKECIDVLQGKGPEDLKCLCRELGSHMIMLGGRAHNLEEAQSSYDDAIASGRAFEKFVQVAKLQGSDTKYIYDHKYFPRSKKLVDVSADRSGIVATIDTRKVGFACSVLGGGRCEKNDVVQGDVGFEFMVRIGDVVKSGQSLVQVHYNDKRRFEEAKKMLVDAIEIGDEKVSPPPLVYEIMSGT